MPKPKSEPFPARLLRLRTAAGLTQRALAEATGCLQASIHDWEHGVNELTVANLRRLAAALGVTLDQLAGEG